MNQAEPVTESAPVALPTVRTKPFDPPTELGRFREEEPVRRLVYPDGHVGWLVTSYELACAVLSDARFSARSEFRRMPVRRPGAETFFGKPALPGWFVDMDPPDHTIYRRVLGGYFTVRRMNELRARIEQIVGEHLAAIRKTGPPVDLVAEFALPVPSLTISELLGVPYADREEFQHNSATLFSLQVTAEEGGAAMRALTDLLRRLIREKRANPTNDLLGNLATAGPLSEDELAGLGVLLLTAGHETIANMLGLGTFVLLSNPDKIAQLRADPGLMKNAVEELLRYLTIFHFGVFRTPLQDVELAGHLIKSGESVTVSLPAANRDPSRFGEPDKLDFDRVPNRHLAFGYGIHQCTGQHLARVEMQCGYAALLREFPTLRLAAPPSEIPMCTDTARYGVHRLPVVW